ncbi:MAG TPA: protease inhibitor I42 family protein [Methylomirabilota bacterium]|nr:protease inhibitor I42 family protein [Methylomirabilota bacterium]
MYLALLGVCLLAAGCATTGPGAGGAGDRDLTVSEGATFTVALEKQGGTGYGWSVAGADTDTVALVERRLERAPGAAPGAPERDVFVFQARRSGTATLRFTYARPWVAPPPPPSHAYHVQVTRC